MQIAVAVLECEKKLEIKNLFSHEVLVSKVHGNLGFMPGKGLFVNTLPHLLALFSFSLQFVKVRFQIAGS